MVTRISPLLSILAQIDGVDQLNNILLIGMTNRKDLIDEALMRPGTLIQGIATAKFAFTARISLLVDNFSVALPLSGRLVVELGYSYVVSC